MVIVLNRIDELKEFILLFFETDLSKKREKEKPELIYFYYRTMR